MSSCGNPSSYTDTHHRRLQHACRKNLRESLLLYAVTDRRWLAKNTTLETFVRDLITGGVTFVQLREKLALGLPSSGGQCYWSSSTDPGLVQLACQVGSVCHQAGVPFVINDFSDLACVSQADGVHIGQEDGSVLAVRSKLDERCLVGVSVSTVYEAQLAEEQGADYLGVGAVFPTSTKGDASRLSHKELKEICSSVSIPVVAIGGITTQNILELKGSGIAGVAVVSALFAAACPRSKAALLRKYAEEVVYGSA